MSNSVLKQYGGPVWPLGFVKVPTPGTKVCVMFNVDPGNNGAPGTVVSQQFPGLEYSPTFKGFAIQGIQPSNNGNPAMVPNAGNIYLLAAPSGNNTGNKSDTGVMIKAIGPGQDFFYPPPSASGGGDRFSGYTLYIDADNANDGAIIVGYGGGN